MDCILKTKRVPIYEGKILIDPKQGLYRITTWFSDGSKEEREEPLAPCCALLCDLRGDSESEEGCMRQREKEK